MANFVDQVKITAKAGNGGNGSASFHREDYPLLASNIAETTRFEMKTPDVKVIVNPERADLVETRVIDGRPCLVIRIDEHIEVNGINVKSISPKPSP